MMAWQVRQSPLLEMKLLVVMYGAICVTILGYLVAAAFQTPHAPVKPEVVYFHRASLFFLLVGETSVIYVFRSPTFRPFYKEVIKITLTQGLFAFSTVWIIWHLNHRISGEQLATTFDPLGLLLAAVSALVISYLITSRVREIKSILGEKKNEFLNSKEISVFNVLFFLLAAFLLVSEVLPILRIPKFSWIIFLSFTMLYFAILFRKNKYLWFITTAQLMRLIVAKKDFSSMLFSWSPNSGGMNAQGATLDSERQKMVIRIFEKLNKSFDNIIKHKKGLIHIRYGDVSVEIAEGSKMIVIIMTTVSNNIVKELTQYFTRKMEKDHQILELIEKEETRLIQEKLVTRPYFQELCQYFSNCLLI